jgi:hypothetical protein
MIEAVRLDFDLVRREDLRFTMTFSTEGRPVDITGWVAAMAIADRPGDAALVSIAMAANANGSRFQIKDAENGVLELFISEADNTGLPIPADPTASRTFAYDIMITGGADGDTNRYFYGQYLVEPGVTP